LTNSNFTLWRMRERIGRFRGEACQLGLPAQFGLNAAIPDEPGGKLELTAADGAERPLGRRVLLLVARMDSREREKGYDLLIEVLPALAERFPDVQVVLAGDGDDRERVRSLAGRHGVGGRVFCPGFVPTITLAELYRRCYAFVLPSRQEGFGLAYLEAMNYGKPCVGCWDQGTEDVIDHGRTGLLIRDVRDGTELRESLLYLLDQPKAAREFGLAGFDRLHAHFTAHQFQHRVREKLVTVLEQR
jgi:glycosyltransferase involved in cell wall biosynthesis